MTEIERFWLDLMDARRYAITEVYGAECASRYKPHPIEKEYFISHAGTFSAHPSVTNHTEAFWQMCEDNYSDQREAYRRKLRANWHRVQQSTEYKNRKREREQLKDYISDAINGNGKETDARTAKEKGR
jgi:hypothetical protein